MAPAPLGLSTPQSWRWLHWCPPHRKKPSWLLLLGSLGHICCFRGLYLGPRHINWCGQEHVGPLQPHPSSDENSLKPDYEWLLSPLLPLAFTGGTEQTPGLPKPSASQHTAKSDRTERGCRATLDRIMFGHGGPPKSCSCPSWRHQGPQQVLEGTRVGIKVMEAGQAQGVHMLGQGEDSKA